MIHKHKESWRKLIEGKIAVEHGHEEDGLRAFEQALEMDPGNEHFRAASEAARRSLGRKLSGPEEALLANVQRKYEELVPALASDEPGRVDGLKELLAELDGHAPSGERRTYTRGLHS